MSYTVSAIYFQIFLHLSIVAWQNLFLPFAKKSLFASLEDSALRDRSWLKILEMIKNQLKVLLPKWALLSTYVSMSLEYLVHIFVLCREGCILLAFHSQVYFIYHVLKVLENAKFMNVIGYKHSLASAKMNALLKPLSSKDYKQKEYLEKMAFSFSSKNTKDVQQGTGK